MTNLTGATSLAATIRTLMANTKKQLDEAGNQLTVAVNELQATADHAVKQVKIVQAETDDLKAALGLGSNGGEPLDDEFVPTHVTPLPLKPSLTTGQFETPPPFNGPATPPVQYDDHGNVVQIKLDNGEQPKGSV
jgi:ABC-type transporter Mla subunit MlaD